MQTRTLKTTACLFGLGAMALAAPAAGAATGDLQPTLRETFSTGAAAASPVISLDAEFAAASGVTLAKTARSPTASTRVCSRRRRGTRCSTPRTGRVSGRSRACSPARTRPTSACRVPVATLRVPSCVPRSASRIRSRRASARRSCRSSFACTRRREACSRSPSTCTQAVAKLRTRTRLDRALRDPQAAGNDRLRRSSAPDHLNPAKLTRSDQHGHSAGVRAARLHDPPAVGTPAAPRRVHLPKQSSRCRRPTS